MAALGKVEQVTRKNSNYLRLHVEEPAAKVQPRPATETACVAALCASFERATGLPLQYTAAGGDGVAMPRRQAPAADHDNAAALARRLTLPAFDPQGNSHPATAQRANPNLPLGDLAALEELVQAVDGLLHELHATREQLWKREAELAAGVPVVVHEEEELHLAPRLEAILKAGAEAVDCQAAAAYLLDEDTRHLKLRSCWGLPRSRFLDGARPLRGSAADLEALVGHAVVIEDAQRLSHWQMPEEFRSAVCVPISSPTVPFGTLWMFCDRARPFEKNEISLIEIVSGRLAAELERAMLLQQCQKSRGLDRQLLHAAQWQRNRLPQIKPLLDHWQVAGWTAQGGRVGGDFHDWSVLPDGRLALAAGHAQGLMIDAALTAAAVHTALKAHESYRLDVLETVRRLNETVWMASTGDQFVSLFYGHLRPEIGEVECVLGGDVHAAVIGDTVQEISSRPATLLGMTAEVELTPQRYTLRRNDILAVVTGGVNETMRDESRRANLRRLWRAIGKRREDSAHDLIEHVKAMLEVRDDARSLPDQTVLIAKRT